MRTTRYPNGVTNVPAANPLGAMGAPDPTRYHTFFDDFDRFVAGDWTITKVGTGTTALFAEDGGVFQIVNSAADDDSVYMQKVGTGFLMELGKEAFFKARFKLSDATQSDFQIGLILTDTTPLDATDGIYFQKSDDAATLDFYCRKDATTGSNKVSAIATLTDATYLNVAWYLSDKGILTYYVNHNALGSFDATAYLPDALLTPSFGVQNGAAVAKSANIDYVFAAKLRF